MIGNNPSGVAHNLSEITKNHGNAEAEEPSGEEEADKEKDERETEESEIGSIGGE